MNLGEFSRARAVQWQQDNPDASPAETIEALNRNYTYEVRALGFGIE